MDTNYGKTIAKIFVDIVHEIGVVTSLKSIAAYCEIRAETDENLVVEAYHDSWMAARTELLRCAETIRKGGE